MSLVGFIGILYVVNLIGQPAVNWGTAAVLLAVSLVAVVGFAVRQFRLTTPLLDLRVFAVRQFNVGAWLTSFSYIALIVVTIIWPLYYQEALGVSPFISGMALVPGAVALSLLNPVTGRLADRLGFKTVLLIGMLMILLGWGMVA